MDDATYEVNGWLKFVEEDSWENGCDGKGTSFQGSDRFHAPSVSELLEQLQDFVYEGSMEIDPCEGEIGRVDFFRMEGASGEVLTSAEETAWRNGEGKAWYAVYTFYVEKVTREPVDLEKETSNV